MNTGWRTVVADSPAYLHYNTGTIVMDKDDNSTVEIPLTQVQELLINSGRSKMSTALIRELCLNNIGIIICDEKQNPICEIMGFGEHHEAAGMIMDQACWSQEAKDQIWKRIVEQKIRNQIDLLKELNRDVPEMMEDYLGSVIPGDYSNREGQAARVYFDSLFEENFRRHSPTKTNAALNYGYTILLSSFNRILSAHGYHTALGIKHCSRNNRFNLSCDLMEPFRPVVDRIVFQNPNRELDWDYKKVFIGMLQEPYEFDGRTMSLVDAEELYALQILNALESLLIQERREMIY